MEAYIEHYPPVLDIFLARWPHYWAFLNLISYILILISVLILHIFKTDIPRFSYNRFPRHFGSDEVFVNPVSVGWDIICPSYLIDQKHRNQKI